MNSKTIFVTDNLKLASSLTAVGFQLINTDFVRKTIDGKQRELVVCEFVTSHLGVETNYLRLAFEEDPEFPEINLRGQVNEIIRKRGITDEEYVKLGFDAARSALHNRSTILFCVLRNLPLICKSINNGRTLIYRDGTPKEMLQQLLDNA
jgi:hypothetical protein